MSVTNLLAFDTLLGVPAHPLLVHVAVVLVPLGFLLALVAVFKKIRQPLLIAAAIAAAVGGIGVLLVAGSGESLERSVKRTELVHDHTEMGDATQAPAVIFGGIAVLAAAEEVIRRGKFSRKMPRLPKWLPSALLVATIASGAVATVFVYEAGHSGAKAVWTGPDGRVVQK